MTGSFIALALSAETAAVQSTWWMRLFNIDSLVDLTWITIGITGQLMFFLRMLIQWVVTERNRVSTVPPVFWWCSIIGATMLLTYFIWRWDIVGIMGQSFGFIVYLRNLQYIHRSRQTDREAAQLDPSPELAEALDDEDVIDTTTDRKGKTSA